MSIYLNIIANTDLKTIYLIDLFAGEGKDIDGKSCSSIAALEALKNHYETASAVCKKVIVFFNDIGDSIIEKSIKKIERVKRFTAEMRLPEQCEVKFSAEDFENIIEKVVARLQILKGSERALCFFDPWGYKYSKPAVLKELLENGKTELILFMPICFMHRFAAKALKDEDFTAGQHIEKFISEIFADQTPDIKNQVVFIKNIQKQLKEYLEVDYVDVLFIEKKANQFFALYFFSNSKRGFQKMLEAKWSIDEKDGRSFSVNKTQQGTDLFENINHEDYSYLLYEELKKAKEMTNQEVFDFGLLNNHLPKHSKKVLDELKKAGKLTITIEDGTTARGYYLEDNHAKRVVIRPINI